MAERRAVEEAKQQLGEEQLAVVELVNQVSTCFYCLSVEMLLLFELWGFHGTVVNLHPLELILMTLLKCCQPLTRSEMSS